MSDVLTWYRWLDAHPEPAWREHETTDYLDALVRGWGCAVRRFDGETGLVAETGSGERVIGIRADIDAIWFGDAETGRAVHACGHSGHMAMALGALRSLLDRPADGATVRVLFQPAEELGEGGPRFIEHGVLDGMTHLYGMHVRPAEELGVGEFVPSLQSGASKHCEVTITGADAHGARLHLGHNAIDPLVAIHAALKSIYLGPNRLYSAKITRIRAGGVSPNVIPGHATLAIDCRAQRNDTMTDVVARIDAFLPAIAATYGVEIEHAWHEGTPAAEVGPEADRLMTEAIIAVAGQDALRPQIVTPGADDFHFYAAAKPGLESTMLGVGCGVTPGLHNPDLTYDPAPFTTAAEILAHAVRRTAAQ